ncbi:MAG TPA: amidase [Alphaproteobacteria bacterium]|nr:amidase [Alphaproteobacteria bacterium]HAJ48681.1 amidase [Alphaproteobacteria bacterium]
MLLHTASWPEIDAYLAKHKGIIIPIGSTEQHGPNGLLGTDALCPEIIAREAALDRDDVLIGPTFNVGQAQHHLGFAGTISLRPSTMIAAMCDWADSLARHGFERLYWFNGHGGNVATITAAFSQMYGQSSFARGGHNLPKLRNNLRNWWELPGVADVIKDIFPVGDGSHATASEVSVTYWAYPQAIKRVEMSPKIAPTGPILDAEDYRRRFPDGRIGSDPSQATPEAGGRIVAKAAQALLVDYEDFLKAA